MTDDFNKFINDRAIRDLRLHREAQTVSVALADSGKHFLSTSLFALGVSADDIYADDETLNRAAKWGLKLAGEVAKHIERNNPSVVEKHPEIPWSSLKRLRDELTHETREGYYIKEKNFLKLEKGADKLHDFVTSTDPQSLAGIGDEEAKPTIIFHGLSFYYLMVALKAAALEQHTPYTSLTSASAQALSQMIGCPPAGLPLLVQQAATHAALNELADTLHEISPFTELTKNPPVNSAPARKLIATRNVWAHFEAGLGQYSFGHDSASLYPQAASLGEVIGKYLGKYAEQANALHPVYHARLGSSIQRPDQLKLLDASVRWIQHHSKGDRNLENAYVYAVIKLVKSAPVDLATKVTDYLESQKGMIRQYDKLAEDTPECPHDIQRTVGLVLQDVKSRMPKKDFTALGNHAALA